MAPNERARKNHEELFPGHVSTLAVTDPELIETFDNFAFDEVLRDTTLTIRTRLMVQLAAIIASQALGEYRVMLGAAPLLCAGITTFSPLRRWGVGAGKKVGVVGLDGLGHMGVKFARAFGARVVVFTTSLDKREDAVRLGAHEVVVSRDEEQMGRHAGSFDFILDTVAADHDVNAYLNLLGVGGNLTLVGAPPQPLPVSAFALLMANRSFSGTNIGGLPETQEMLDFCGEHNITADVEVIPVQQVDEAYERLLKSDVKYRFAIDMASLKSE